MEKLGAFEKIVNISGILSGISFIVSLFFVQGVTGWVIGETQENMYVLIVFMAFSFIWTLLVFSWYVKHKREKQVDVKEILKKYGKY
ncbi:hypothetical protein GOV14_07180 [Candidatus Pacearchaeota archaeon]|nr:hypothetical protein [Candidatus Pacearchaeota archaeon]